MRVRIQIRSPAAFGVSGAKESSPAAPSIAAPPLLCRSSGVTMQAYRFALWQCTNSGARRRCLHAICALNRVQARSYRRMVTAQAERHAQAQAVCHCGRRPWSGDSRQMDTKKPRAECSAPRLNAFETSPQALAVAPAFTRSRNDGACRAAPPIKPPSISGCASSSGALSGFIEPP